MPVTRTELTRHLQAAFTRGPATRDMQLAHAATSHARPAVIDIIRGLPDQTYNSIGELPRDLSQLS